MLNVLRREIFWSCFSTFGPPVPFPLQYPHFRVFWSVLRASIPTGPLLSDPRSSVLKSYVQYCSYSFSTAGFFCSFLAQIFPTCWSAADTLIFSGRGYSVYSCLLPLWTQYLSRTVLGVAAPLAEPTKTSRPWKQHVRLPFGVVVLKEVSAW